MTEQGTIPLIATSNYEAAHPAVGGLAPHTRWSGVENDFCGSHTNVLGSRQSCFAV